jgi:hypothetical protein
VGVKYFDPGPMGISRGIVVILQPDPAGKTRIRIEPFCLLPDLQGRVWQDMRHITAVDVR